MGIRQKSTGDTTTVVITVMIPYQSVIFASLRVLRGSGVTIFLNFLKRIVSTRKTKIHVDSIKKNYVPRSVKHIKFEI